MFKKILIANRGEIACRVIRTAQEMGIKTVAVYSDADANALHVAVADEAVHIGPAPTAESYLVGDKILQAAKDTGAEAIHPGYGFLSENPEFSEACAAAGITFIGPSADSMRAMALKGAAKKLMTEAGVPVVPGYHGDDQSDDVLKKAADDMGYPVLIKAVAGGGGKGMRPVAKTADFMAALSAARREAKNSFGNDKVLVEKLIEKPRHIELQVFGDSHGNVVHLFERDCSLQRRHQKVVEEAPAPDMSDDMRAKMGDAAVKAAAAIDYVGAGTVEFIVDVANGLEDAPFYFMEMNTRLQVEHPVTEMITGQDLVAWQLEVAAGSTLPLKQDEIKLNGHAVEVRLYAEDPNNDFLPAAGDIIFFDTPEIEETRVETGVMASDTVSIHYDPMIAKLVAWGENREQALDKLTNLTQMTAVMGLTSNRAFLINALTHPEFINKNLDTGFIDRNIEELLPTIEITAFERAIASYSNYQNNLEEKYNQFLDGCHEFSDIWDEPLDYEINLTSYQVHLYQGTKEPITQYLYFLNSETKIIESGTEFHFTTPTDDTPYTNKPYILRWDKPTPYNPMISIVINDRKILYSAFTSDHTTYISTAYGDFTIPLIGSGNFANDNTSGSGTLTAPMPGKILEIHVKNGDTVTKGDPLIVMEAMKMEQTQLATKDGTIADLTLNAGDQVTDGQHLLTIEDKNND